MGQQLQSDFGVSGNVGVYHEHLGTQALTRLCTLFLPAIELTTPDGTFAGRMPRAPQIATSSPRRRFRRVPPRRQPATQ